MHSVKVLRSSSQGNSRGLVITAGRLVYNYVNWPSGSTAPTNAIVVNVSDNGAGTAATVTLPDPDPLDPGTIIYLMTFAPQALTCQGQA